MLLELLPDFIESPHPGRTTGLMIGKLCRQSRDERCGKSRLSHQSGCSGTRQALRRGLPRGGRKPGSPLALLQVPRRTRRSQANGRGQVRQWPLIALIGSRPGPRRCSASSGGQPRRPNQCAPHGRDRLRTSAADSMAAALHKPGDPARSPRQQRSEHCVVRCSRRAVCANSQ
jgi:hypothetical protein